MMKLTKEECLEALDYILENQRIACITVKSRRMLEQLINEHFDFLEKNKHNHKPLIECDRSELLDCIKIVFYENARLNKALDKACDELNEWVHSCGCNNTGEMYGIYPFDNAEQWKEWYLNETN